VEKSIALSVLMGEPEGKRQLGGTRRKWEYNIKMNTIEKLLGGVD
jgi:hypothetical protein